MSNEYIEVKDGQIMIKKEVDFEPNSAVLDNDDLCILDAISYLVRSYPRIKLKIVGFTNAAPKLGRDEVMKRLIDGNQNPVQGNYKLLSKLRAEAVQTYLNQTGVANERMSSEGHGTDGGGKRTSIFAGPTEEAIQMAEEMELMRVSRLPEVLKDKAKMKKEEQVMRAREALAARRAAKEAAAKAKLEEKRAAKAAAEARKI
jgi:hypothetical protein